MCLEKPFFKKNILQPDACRLIGLISQIACLANGTSLSGHYERGIIFRAGNKHFGMGECEAVLMQGVDEVERQSCLVFRAGMGNHRPGGRMRPQTPSF